MTGDGRRRPTGDAVPRLPMQVMSLPGSAMSGLTMGRYGRAQRRPDAIRVSTPPRMLSSLARKLRHPRAAASGRQKPQRSSVSSYTNDHPRIAEKDARGVRCPSRASGPSCRRPALAIPEGRSHPGLAGPARLTCLPGGRAVHGNQLPPTRRDAAADRVSDGTGRKNCTIGRIRRTEVAPHRQDRSPVGHGGHLSAQLGLGPCAVPWPACPARIYGRVRRPRGCGLPTK